MWTLQQLAGLTESSKNNINGDPLSTGQNKRKEKTYRENTGEREIEEQ